jgi:secreted trypsin-like serine protease
MIFPSISIKNIFYSSILASAIALPSVQSTFEELAPLSLPLFEDGVDIIELPPEESTSSIIGGSNAARGSYPWYSMLLIASSTAYNYSGCGGTLVSPEFVLTAASCVRDDLRTNGAVWIGALQNTQNNGNQSSQIIRVKKVFTHPQYQSGEKLNNDFALVQLSFRSIISPADIDSSNTSDGYSNGKIHVTMMNLNSTN